MRYKQTILLLLSIFGIIAISGSYVISNVSAQNASVETLNTVNTLPAAAYISVSNAINDTTPELNVLNKSSPYYIGNKSSPYYGLINVNDTTRQIPGVFYETSSLSPLTVTPFTMADGAWGTDIYSQNQANIVGVYAQQQIVPNNNFLVTTGSVDVRLYAPSLESVNANPLEVVTVYEKSSATGPTTLWLGVWLHDNPEHGFMVIKPFDSLFISKYVVNNAGKQVYNVKIMKSGNTYTAYILNNQLQLYEVLYSTTGNDQWNRQDGWNYFETKFVGISETSVPHIESQYLEVIDSNGIPYTANSNYAALWPNTGLQQTYKCNMISQYDHWSVSS